MTKWDTLMWDPPILLENKNQFCKDRNKTQIPRKLSTFHLFNYIDPNDPRQLISMVLLLNNSSIFTPSALTRTVATQCVNTLIHQEKIWHSHVTLNETALVT